MHVSSGTTPRRPRTCCPSRDDTAPELDELWAAIPREPAAAPGDASMSLPRLSKRLGMSASVLMLALSAMSHGHIGGVEGAGRVRVILARAAGRPHRPGHGVHSASATSRPEDGGGRSGSTGR